MRNSRVYADINLSAVLHNLEEMHKNISDETQIVAVIKTDAYGHGALPIAEAIEHVHICGDMQLQQLMKQCL
jgi:alanine racemase